MPLLLLLNFDIFSLLSYISNKIHVNQFSFLLQSLSNPCVDSLSQGCSILNDLELVNVQLKTCRWTCES